MGRRRDAGNPAASVTASTALRNSAVWACTGLRAGLISTMPIDTFRRLPGVGVDVETVKPLVLIEPSSYAEGQPQPIGDWLYASQMDLDRCGNAFGLITARDGLGLPARVDLVPFEDVKVKVRGSRIVNYQFGRTDYTSLEVWHERQYILSGVPLGLSPIAYAAWSIAGYLSAQAFAVRWFAGGAVPSGDLMFNGRGDINPTDAEIHKRRFMAAVGNGEPFVHGKDWTYVPVGSKASDAKFLEQMNYGVADVCRFLGVPGDMIDAPQQGSSVTYANITQRNLQFMITNLGPAITRREGALSRWLAKPRFVKLNTDAILRMDPQQRTQILLDKVQGKLLTPSEARSFDNLPPFTPEQIAELTEMQILADRSPLKTAPGGTS